MVVLEKLKSSDIERLLKRALSRLEATLLEETKPVSSAGTGNLKILMDRVALTALADLSDGDARIALNGLQFTIQTKRALLNEHLKLSKTTGTMANVSGSACENDKSIACGDKERAALASKDKEEGESEQIQPQYLRTRIKNHL